MKVTRSDLVEIISEVYDRKTGQGSQRSKVKKLRTNSQRSNTKTLLNLSTIINEIVDRKLQEIDFDENPGIKEPGLIEDDFGFAAGMNKAIKGRLTVKNSQEMQSLLWKSVTNELTEPNKESLRKYWLKIFDGAIEEKFIGKDWYPFTTDEIESDDEIVDSDTMDTDDIEPDTMDTDDIEPDTMDNDDINTGNDEDEDEEPEIKKPKDNVTERKNRIHKNTRR